MRTSESQSPRILVVDDDAVVRRMLSDTLGRAGYAVVQACSTTEALRVAADEEPALAIVALVLPDGDGMELLSQLRASWPTLPALVVAACVELRSIVEAMRRGAHDYLSKPLDPDVLLSACRAALARRPVVKAPVRPAELPIVGASAETARVRETLSRLAPTRPAGVLIVGDAGVGKTWPAGPLPPRGGGRAPGAAFPGLPAGRRGRPARPRLAGQRARAQGDDRTNRRRSYRRLRAWRAPRPGHPRAGPRLDADRQPSAAQGDRGRVHRSRHRARWGQQDPGRSAPGNRARDLAHSLATPRTTSPRGEPLEDAAGPGQGVNSALVGGMASSGASPEAAQVSADFLTLLLLTICVGAETSQSESDTSDPTDDQPLVRVGSVTLNVADVTTIGTPTI